ncbi:MAG: Bax inhibitor-1/YccA family protein [Rhodobacterales bacterium]|jgi:FtsH-binding integral membrane protein|nr:Bax inhibitor-1/YccA family protein [Rhodobacterales bacterium]
MNDFNRAYTPRTGAGSMDMSVNEGLRAFMLGVYNKMALGLLLTAGLAYGVGALVPESVTLTLLTGPLGMIIMFAPLAILLISSFAMRNPSPLGANLVYWSVVSLIGISMGAIVYVYARQPDGMFIVSKAFLTTAIAFGALSLYGYTTKRDLSGFGTFLIMGVVGIIVASLLNMFIFKSSMFHMVISVVGLLLFAGLTAWDTQRLKNMYFQIEGNVRAISVATTYGALSLYLDFINMFQFLLSIMSPRN